MNPGLNDKVLTALLVQQAILQQQLIEAQQEIIALHRKIDRMTPKKAKDKNIFWHLVSDGLSSVEAAKSTDPITVRQFRDWIVKFARKHIKPYVNDKVYGECLNQMTRGLAERVADLENDSWERARSGNPTQPSLTSFS